jgi:rhodanese-related sulfurtransferase
MASSVKDMLAAANFAVPRIQPADLRDRMSKGDVVVVDVRDAPELATGGKIKGAVHVPRGMLEFRADPESPYHNPALRKEKTVVLYCASGGRSGTCRKNAARAWLQVGLQCGRLQGFAVRHLQAAGRACRSELWLNPNLS